jgi:FkbM family methyltransferase
MVKFRRLLHPIELRPGTTDVTTLVNNAVRLEYGQFKVDKEREYVIVDAGAYIGDTSAFFLTSFPRAKVIALEPNPESFAIAKRNLAPYGARARLLNVGLLDRNEQLYLSGSTTGAHLSQSGDARVSCITVSDILQKWCESKRIDILKLDIEGAETVVLGPSSDEWLSGLDPISWTPDSP